jgi:hypothetical protein
MRPLLVVVFERPVVTSAAAATSRGAVPASAVGAWHHAVCAAATGLAMVIDAAPIGQGITRSRPARRRARSPGTLRQRRRGDARQCECSEDSELRLVDHSLLLLGDALLRPCREDILDCAVHKKRLFQENVIFYNMLTYFLSASLRGNTAAQQQDEPCQGLRTTLRTPILLRPRKPPNVSFGYWLWKNSTARFHTA